MKERPILFSGAMVRAILEGRKTVTRRLIKPQPYIDNSGNFCWNGRNYGQNENGPRSSALASPLPCSKTNRIACPFGKAGDRLWVRETFATLSAGEYEPVKPRYGYLQEVRFAATDPLADCDVGVRGYPWRPSIHMPRWACRLALEITAVRVERLQDISEEQALAEGVASCAQDLDPDGNGYSPGELFSILWSSINGTDSWNANPWVWVIEFKRVAP